MILLSFNFKPVLVIYNNKKKKKKPNTENKTLSEDLEPTDGQDFVGINGLGWREGNQIYWYISVQQIRQITAMLGIKRWLKDFEDISWTGLIQY